MTPTIRRALPILVASCLFPSLLFAQPQPGAPPAGPGPPVMRRMSLPPVQSTGSSARVSARKVNGILVVPATVNGHGPFWFAMDTGAMGHARINEALAAKLGLAVAGKARAGDPSGKNPREVNLYSIDSLKIGDVTFRGAMATGSADTIRRLVGVDGILGIDLFTDFLLKLDYPKTELSIARGGALPEPDGKSVLSYSHEHGAIEIPLRAGDRELPTDLDTGNMIAPFVFPTAFADSLPHQGEPRDGGVARTASNEVKIYKVTLAVPVQVGALEFANAEVAYPALHDRGNIGSQALADCTVEIDQKNKRVRLTRGAAAGVPTRTR